MVGPNRDTDFKSTGLYDLAWQLVRDESGAEELVRAALCLRNRIASQKGERDEDVRGLLVRIYIEGHYSRLTDFTRFIRRPSTRRKRTATGKLNLGANLDQLRPEEWACLILRERLEIPIAELAQITGLGLEGARVALFSARERLRAVGKGGTVILSNQG